MDHWLLTLLPETVWQWLNLVACTIAAVSTGIICAELLDADDTVWDNRDPEFWLLKNGMAVVTAAFAIVAITEVEVLVYEYGAHKPTEVVLNAVLALLFTTMTVVAYRMRGSFHVES